MSDIELSQIEQKLDKICQGDVMCKQLTPWGNGAVPSLVRKGLVEVYKKNVSPNRVRVLKFLRVKV